MKKHAPWIVSRTRWLRRTGYSEVAPVSVGVVLNGFTVWSTAEGLSGDSADMSSDPDGDGINNLLEFAIAGDPLAASESARLPAASPIPEADGAAFIRLAVTVL